MAFIDRHGFVRPQLRATIHPRQTIPQPTPPILPRARRMRLRQTPSSPARRTWLQQVPPSPARSMRLQQIPSSPAGRMGPRQMLRSRIPLALVALGGLALFAPAASAGAVPAPNCARGNHNRSMARAGGALTVSPEPGTRDANPHTQISIVGVPAASITTLTVTGGRSGQHTGRLLGYSQADGASFIPVKPFTEGERVTVHVVVQIEGRPRVVGWRFSIDYKAGLGATYRKNKEAKATAAHHRRARRERSILKDRPRALAQATTARSASPAHAAADLVQSFHSQPNLHPPAVTVTVNRNLKQPGYLFMSPFSDGQAGPMILDDTGAVVWFRPVNTGPTAATKATNLQVQTYDGQPVLTYWQDPLIPNGNGRRDPQDVVLNTSYRHLATIHAGNGSVADVHELTITPQGTALIAVKQDIRCNLSSIGGTREGSIWNGVVQEVDIATGLVRWEWNSLDHVSLSEAYDSAKFATASYPYDSFHLNSIQLLGPGSLLASARNTWTIYDIDRHTGLIRWRLGGKHSNFKMGPGTRTAWQHDARTVSPSPGKKELLISVFDNGATPKEHPQSRGVIELVNLANHTATLERALTNIPPLLAGSQGSVQPLPNGDTVVGWGQKAWVTEYDPEGQITFQAHLPSFEQSYRALRYEWHATPATPPKVAVEHTSSKWLAIYASWNGATEVSRWQVLEGNSTATLKVVAVALRSGFETRINAPASGTTVEVQALNAAGEVIGTSPPKRV